MDEKAVSSLIERVAEHLDRPRRAGGEPAFGNALAWDLDESGRQALDHLVTELRADPSVGSSVSADDLRELLLARIITWVHEKRGHSVRAVYRGIRDELTDVLPWIVLAPVPGLALPMDLVVGSVSFFYLTGPMRREYEEQASLIIGATADAAETRDRMDSEASDTLRSSDTWGRVNVTARARSAWWVAQQRLRAALEILNLFVASVGKNPLHVSLMVPPGITIGSVGRLLLAPNQRAILVRELAVPRGRLSLSPADVGRICSDPLFQRACEILDSESLSDFEVRLLNAAHLFGQATASDLAEETLPDCWSALETIFIRERESGTEERVRRRLIGLNSWRNEAWLNQTVNKIFELRNTLSHKRLEHAFRTEEAASSLRRDALFVSLMAIIGGLQRWEPGKTLSAFVDELDRNAAARQTPGRSNPSDSTV